MFSGQVIDALATPVVGVLADQFNTKKRWHLAGKQNEVLNIIFLFDKKYINHLCIIASDVE